MATTPTALLLLPFLLPMSLSPIPHPKTYVCLRAATPPSLDADLRGPAWAQAPWTDDFVDIEGDAKPKPRFRTRAKMLWDDRCLYIGAHMEEPNVWATLTEHDSVIFHDNDFEVFLDPNNTGAPYVELEMNALNTTWDLLLPRPYRGGGPALNGWEIKGLETAVHVDGFLNDAVKGSQGWSVEIAIPWKALEEICQVSCPPKTGDQWRINFSRVEWKVKAENGRYQKLKGLPEDNWVWSPQGVVDMHRPERWGVLQFCDRTAGPEPAAPLPGLAEKEILVGVWEAEQSFRRAHGRWSANKKELGISTADVVVEATGNLFEVAYKGYHVDQSLRFWRT